MAKEPIDMKKNLQNIWLDMHFLQDIACSKEENKQFRQLKKNGEALPDGIREYQDVNGVVTGEFFRIYDGQMQTSPRQGVSLCNSCEHFSEFMMPDLLKTRGWSILSMVCCNSCER